MASTLAGLVKILPNVRSNRWLYMQTVEGDWPYNKKEIFCLTREGLIGYWDKFCICLWDLLTCDQSAIKTQAAVNKLFNAHFGNLSAGKLKLEMFAKIEDVDTWLKCQQKLSNISLAWNKKVAAPEAPAHFSDIFRVDFFAEQQNKMQAFVSILTLDHPRVDRINVLTQQFHASLEALQKANENPVAVRAHLWCEAAGTLRDLKLVFRERAEGAEEARKGVYFYTLEEAIWMYKVGRCGFTPAGTEVLRTAGNFTKSIDYLRIDLDLFDLFDREISEQELNELVDKVMEDILAFLRKQRSSQRRPVSIFVPGIPGLIPRLSPSNKQVVEIFTHKALELIGKHPDLFICQTSLYEEVLDSDCARKGVCLSRVTGEGAQIAKNSDKTTFVPLRQLSVGTRAVIQRLKSEEDDGKENGTSSVGVKKALEMQRWLLSQNKGTDCVLRFLGKDVGCHSEILEEAFPFFKGQRSFGGNADRDVLDLGAIECLKSLSPDVRDWVFDAVRCYAYTREHPNLPTNCTPQYEKAHTAYLQCVDYLDPRD